jgi:hypothetical protein
MYFKKVSRGVTHVPCPYRHLTNFQSLGTILLKTTNYALADNQKIGKLKLTKIKIDQINFKEKLAW